MAVELDPKSGLPLLPEGHWWQVRDSGGSQWHVTIVRWQWSARLRKWFPVGECVGVIEKWEKEFIQTTEDSTEEERIEAEHWGSLVGGYWKYIKENELSPELVAECAARTYDKWIEELAEKAKQEAKRNREAVLIGNYPPQVLPSVPTSAKVES